MKHSILVLCMALLHQWAVGQADRHSTNLQDAWLSCSTSQNPNTARGNTHWIMYDFKDIYSLHQSTFWNFNTPTRLNHYNNESWSYNLLQGSLEDGLKDVFIDISLDGVNWQEWGRFTLQKANGSGFYQGNAGPDFNGKIARYVLITARNNYGGTCYGLGEVRIEATPATISKNEDENSTKSYISVSPNPAKDFIQVGLESFPTGTAAYQILDVQGKILKTGSWEIQDSWTSHQISVQNINTGSYVLQVISGDMRQSILFDIIH